MKRLSLGLGLLALVTAVLVSPAAQADRVPSTHYQPPHRMADQPNNACPAGWSRLFGRNPPTCFQNCPPDYQIWSHHVSGAWCFWCPPGYSLDPADRERRWCCREMPFGQLDCGRP